MFKPVYPFGRAPPAKPKSSSNKVDTNTNDPNEDATPGSPEGPGSPDGAGPAVTSPQRVEEVQNSLKSGPIPSQSQKTPALRVRIMNDGTQGRTVVETRMDEIEPQTLESQSHPQHSQPQPQPSQQTEKKDPASYTYADIAREIFSRPDADVKFTDLLIAAKRTKVFLMHKTFNNLNDNEPPEKRDDTYYIIIRGIMKLVANPYGTKASVINQLTSALLTDARHFPTPTLTQVVNYGLEYMERTHESDLQQRWIEIFTRMVGVLTTHDEIKFNDDVIDGNELRNQVILSICRIPWGSNNTASVISVFREIPGVTTNEIAIILDKVGSILRKLDPAAIPAIAYQLLHLAGDLRPASLVYHIDLFFKSITFSEQSNDPANEIAKRRKSLGSTVYFFIQYARNSTPLVKEIVKHIKMSANDVELLRSPFILSVCLGLTSIEHLKHSVVDSLKHTLVKHFLEASFCIKSYWYNETVDRPINPDGIVKSLKMIIDSKSTELDFMLDGLKELAMGLLNVDQLREKNALAAEKSKNLGIHLMTSIVKRNKEHLSGIMNELLKNQKLPFVECLGSCLKTMVRTVIQPAYTNRVIQLIQYLPRMSVDTASIIIKALLPSLQLSHGLMDEMLMLLRKTTWKSAEARRISLAALVLMLANSRIIGNIPNSQYSENSEAFFSQISQTQIDVFGNARSNEPLVFEIISVLKRFFSLQLEVREFLYLELHTVIRKNPELVGVVGSQLLSHVKSYIDESGDLSLEKILDYSNIRELKLKESLGLLIQCLCSITLRGQRVFRNNGEERPPSLIGCEEFLERFKNQLLLHGQEYYETEATKYSSESSQAPLDFWDVRNARNTLINEILGALEAYVEFTSLGGKIGEDEEGSLIVKLFKKYKQLKSIIEKLPPKQKGGTKKKGQNETIVQTQGTQQPGVSQPKGPPGTDAGNGTLMEPKSKAKPDGHLFKKKFVYQYIIALDSVHEILKDFYGENTIGLPTVDTGDADYEKYLLCVVLQKLEKLKQKENINERKRKPKDMVATLAGIMNCLWSVCLKRIRPIPRRNTSANETTVAVEDLRIVRVEIISSLLDFIEAKYPSHLLECLNIINEGNVLVSENESPREDDYDMAVFRFFTTWERVVKKTIYAISLQEDPSLTRELQFMFKILNKVHSAKMSGYNYAVPHIPDWLKEFMTTNRRNLVTSCPLVESWLQLYVTSGAKFYEIPKDFLSLARQAHYVLEDTDNETMQFAPENGEVSWLVNKETGTTIISGFAHYVEDAIKMVNEVLGKLKAHSAFIDIEKLGKWRDECCKMMEFLLQLLTELIRSDFSSTSCGDILLKVVAQFYLTMSTLTGDMMEVHNKNKVDFSSKRYEQLVRLIGKDFKIRVEGLINHIEAIGKEACVKNKKGVVAASVKQKFSKDAKTVPELVYNMERYEQQVIALSKKTKNNLLVGTKLSTARDFKIKSDQLGVDEPVERDTTNEGVSLSRKRKHVENVGQAQPENGTPVAGPSNAPRNDRNLMPPPKKKKVVKPIYSSTPMNTPGRDRDNATSSGVSPSINAFSPIGENGDQPQVPPENEAPVAGPSKTARNVPISQPKKKLLKPTYSSTPINTLGADGSGVTSSFNVFSPIPEDED